MFEVCAGIPWVKYVFIAPQTFHSEWNNVSVAMYFRSASWRVDFHNENSEFSNRTSPGSEVLECF
jgi:hypothetical protein